MHYIQHLQKDPLLSSILGNDVHTLNLHHNIPLRLMASIMSQQLNTKVAATIFKRFLGLYGDKEPTPEDVIQTPIETLRSIGLSNNKANYLHHVAHFCSLHQITDTLLLSLPNEAIIELLTQIKGVGKWTVEMLLMFSLGREDVFAVDDLGIQNAMKRLYGLGELDKKALKVKMVEISNHWKPYRSYACLHLWRWKDMAPEL